MGIKNHFQQYLLYNGSCWRKPEYSEKAINQS